MTRTLRGGAAAALVAVVLAGCGHGGPATASSTTPLARPSSPARVAILAPKSGQVVHGSSVEVKVALTGGKIVPATTQHIVPTKGHIHLLVDDQVVSMNFGLNQRLGDLKPGTHTLRVEFVASDHLPFDPRVFAQIAFEVKP
jgi:hypothetical protein